MDEFEKCFGHHPSSIRNEQAYQQIKEMIQKPGVTEEWIEEKAQEVMMIIDDPIATWSRKVKNVRNFIHSLMEEIHERK